MLLSQVPEGPLRQQLAALLQAHKENAQAAPGGPKPPSPLVTEVKPENTKLTPMQASYVKKLFKDIVEFSDPITAESFVQAVHEQWTHRDVPPKVISIFKQGKYADKVPRVIVERLHKAYEVVQSMG